MSRVRCLTVLAAVLVAAPAPASVVVNEILYHAPEDLDDLQFVELHNPTAAAVDLAGWKLAKAVRYTFPAGTTLDAGGYLVVVKDAKLFKRWYGLDAAGVWEGALPQNGGEVELQDAAGKKIDGVKYRTRSPWPLAADGYSSSLERICPTAAAATPENWAASPLPTGPRKPSGTPGKKNANYKEQLPPVVSKVTFTPKDATPDDAITVEADVAAATSVELLYRQAGTNYERAEVAVKMTKLPTGRYSGTIPAQKAGEVVRFRVRAKDATGNERLFPSENDVKPTFSVYVRGKWDDCKIPQALLLNVGKPPAAPFRLFGGPWGAPQANPPPRGRAAVVYYDPATKKAELFDYVHILPRNAGVKVRFHKDQRLAGMSTINLIYEYMDRMVLAEPLAYDVYRKAGNVAPRAHFVRTTLDGRPQGFQLLVEQPNTAFLAHNDVEKGGNLYKCIWTGSGLIGTHEKKTNTTTGHDDLVKIVGELNRTKGDAQWEVIKKNFDVEQVINYFAVNMVLSHWDGYFNNYFTYHDVKGTGKWTMYPWDQDKTWGFHDGLGAYDIFTDMPVTFGMLGDRPPGWPKDRPPPNGFGFGSIWWRPGGVFSKPLLANERFRKLFLARTKEILEKVYSEEAFFPTIKALGELAEDEVRYRAKLQGQDGKAAVDHLSRNLDVLREHLTKRRKWLLAQDEIKTAGKFDRGELR